MRHKEIVDQSGTVIVRALEVVVPAAIAVFLYFFRRVHEREYLRVWFFFWIWLAIHHLAVSITPETANQGFSTGIAVLMVVQTSALWLAVVHLGAGSFSALRLRPVRRKLQRTLIVLAILGGVGIVVAVSSLAEAGEAMEMSLLINGLSLGAAYLCCSAMFWRPGVQERASWFLLAIVLMIAGGNAVAGALLQSQWETAFGFPHAVFEFVIEGAIAVAMVVRLLDEERLAALSAASQVAHMVYHEELTGLANRSLLLDRLTIAMSQAERRNKLLALVFMDIDGFKPVNDTLGHDVGDELLKEFADRVCSVVRSEDTVARFGGDEFVILISDLRSPEDMGKIGVKLTEAIRKPFQLRDHEVSVTTSVGIAIYPEDGTDADTLLKNADTAMYLAKDQGGNRFHLYSVRMNHRALEKLELENGLRRALEFRQLELHFEPVFRGSTLALIGFEAHLYWDHPGRGLLPAEEFMPAAERSPMLVSLGRFVIGEACRQLSHLQRKGGDGLFVAINVSNADLAEHDLTSHLDLSLKEYQLDPRCVEIELGEAASNSEITIQAAAVARLREIGTRVVIEHFGAQAGSMRQVLSVAPDVIKLSSAMTSSGDERERRVAAGIVAASRGLGIEVGIEALATSDEVDAARHAGYDQIQGPALSPPISPEDVADFVERASQSH